MRLLIAIPAFNEEKSVGKVVEDLKSHGFEVLVIDDGSSDDTRRIALESGARVLSHLQNLGQGSALRTAMELCLKENWDAILTMDADGQHDVESVMSISKAWAQNPSTDVLLGSRFIGQRSNVPLGRKLLLKLATLFTKIVSGLNVSDTHNGIRVLSRKACSAIKLRQPRMAHASEILSQIRINNLSWKEWPVKIHYTKYSVEKGQTLIAGSLQIVWDLIARGR